MLTPNFLSADIDGFRFDNGMCLLEFDTISRTDTPDLSTYTGAYKGCGRFTSLVESYIRERFDIVEIPTPQMLLPGVVARDACITNYFDAADPSKLRYLVAETMARKILGIPYKTIADGYYRAGWCPPPHIKKGLRPVTFHYPKAGYFGIMAETLGVTPSAKRDDLDTVELSLAFVTGIPDIVASVLFVVTASPIYRVTNQDTCIGMDGNCRMVVEYRGACDVAAELDRLGICSYPTVRGTKTIRYPLPTVANLRKAPDLYANTFNAQILKGIINAKTVT
jgi:hypothetical protein